MRIAIGNILRMAKPRVFISSTFFDLRQIREELERFILEMGYEPVRHETGAIPYSREEPLASSAYREVELCDIIVTVLGGRFGTASGEGAGHSITQKELQTALERGIQVYIFVEHGVHFELSNYRLNKANPDVKYSFVDNIKIFEFLDELHKLPRNNPITGFQTGKDIVEFLRAQWAGLFQHFLRTRLRANELDALSKMQSITNTLQKLVDVLATEHRSSDDVIKFILISNHPAFLRFAKLTNTPYRVFFETIEELDVWLKVRGYERIEDEPPEPGSFYEWIRRSKDAAYLISVTHDIFDEDGRLKAYSRDWDDNWIQRRKLPLASSDEPTDAPI